MTDYNNLSSEELDQKIKETESRVAFYNASQHSKKKYA